MNIVITEMAAHDLRQAGAGVLDLQSLADMVGEHPRGPASVDVFPADFFKQVIDELFYIAAHDLEDNISAIVSIGEKILFTVNSNTDADGANIWTNITVSRSGEQYQLRKMIIAE